MTPELALGVPGAGTRAVPARLRSPSSPPPCAGVGAAPPWRRLLSWLALLLLAAWLAENGRESECDRLLAWHLLPWSTRFLSVFVDNAGHPFYIALGRLAQLTLADWRSALVIPVAEKTLYR